MDTESQNTRYTPKTDHLEPPWPTGVSGNPNGRPKGSRNRSTIVREILEARHPSGLPNVDVMTLAIAEKALAGDVTAWEKLMDSGFGKVTDKIEQETKVTVVDDVTQKVLNKLSSEELEELAAQNND